MLARLINHLIVEKKLVGLSFICSVNFANSCLYLLRLSGDIFTYLIPKNVCLLL